MPLRLVVIGGSAGAAASMLKIIRCLPADFPAPICVSLHISPHGPNLLPQIFTAAGKLSAVAAEDGMVLSPHQIYVAPPNFHLTVADGRLSLSHGAKENYHRPAIDPLFRSAAAAYGEDVLAVLLSGYLNDGTAGLVSIKRRKGTVIIEDPDSSHHPDMPREALHYVEADYVLPVAQIGPQILQCVGQGPHEARTNESRSPGKASLFLCPSCKGPLWEIEADKLDQYQCHEGHAFSSAVLAKCHEDSIEAALWMALRALDDKAELARRVIDRASQSGNDAIVDRFKAQEDLAKSHAASIRKLLMLSD